MFVSAHVSPITNQYPSGRNAVEKRESDKRDGVSDPNSVCSERSVTRADTEHISKNKRCNKALYRTGTSHTSVFDWLVLFGFISSIIRS